MTCNRCQGPLLPDQVVQPSFSGLHPYAHAEPVDCPVLRAELRRSGPAPPLRLMRDIDAAE
ncbi:MAG: hypothetical protein QOG77_2558 [Solirubrobacteraceae bacterium]|jgi:hypothetical protein|nr:hypothetical protein [Solirubrobacteraceae bacterium]